MRRYRHSIPMIPFHSTLSAALLWRVVRQVSLQFLSELIPQYLPIIKKGYNVLDCIDSSRLGQAAKDRYRNFQVTVLVPYDTEMFNGFEELYLEAFLAEYDKE